jgi:hypothetical protein
MSKLRDPIVWGARRTASIAVTRGVLQSWEAQQTKDQVKQIIPAGFVPPVTEEIRSHIRERL